MVELRVNGAGLDVGVDGEGIQGQVQDGRDFGSG